jgi:cytochrome c oxidase assembly protein Cox11
MTKIIHMRNILMASAMIGIAAAGVILYYNRCERRDATVKKARDLAKLAAKHLNEIESTEDRKQAAKLAKKLR